MSTLATVIVENPHPKVVLLKVSGELDENNLAVLADAIAPFLPEDELTPSFGTVKKTVVAAVASTGKLKAILLDLSRLSYLNSAVIGALVGYHTRCFDAHQEFAFIAVHPASLDLLEMLGVTNIIDRYETVAEAIAELDL